MIMSSTPGDQQNAAREALAEALGTSEIDIVGEVTGRLPTGGEVRLVRAAVRGAPNSTASVVVDAAGAVHPRRRFEALAGRGPLPPPATPGPGPPIAPGHPV